MFDTTCARIHTYTTDPPSDRRSHTAGELKILILGSVDGRGRAALRLHENSDNGEDGCLWRMRSEDEGVLTTVKQILGA